MIKDISSLAFEMGTNDVNVKYFHNNFIDLRDLYGDEWIAILDKKVVGHNLNYKDLIQSLNEEGIRGAYIEKVDITSVT